MEIRHVKRAPARLWRRMPGWPMLLAIAMALSVMMLAMLAAIPVLSPETGALAADALRAVVGPTPVAMLESVSSRIQDVFNRLFYEVTGGQPQLTWTNEMPAEAAAAPTSSPPEAGGAQQAAGQRQGGVSPASAASPARLSPLAQPAHGSTPGVAALPPPNPLPDVVTAPPLISQGWQPFGPLVNGKPVLARASLKPDPTRAYAQAAVVRIDLSQTRLYVVPGTNEPAAAPGVPRFARPGMIPADVQASGTLLAAFNGGFKAVNGHYGMMVNGVTILPPLDTIATLALYRDGSVRLGAWGRDITPAPDLIAYRQNCPLLLDAGQINPAVNDGSRAEWGSTVHNMDTTWRSGLGISRDRRFLIYAVGNSLTVQSLVGALQTAGAYYAMQLDINGAFTHLDTFQPAQNAGSGHPVVAVKLLNQMVGGPKQFLVPDGRDFFYVTAAPHSDLNAAALPTQGWR